LNERTVTRGDIAAWLIAAAALVLVIKLKLLSALLAGLLVFKLVDVLTPWLRLRALGRDGPRVLAVTLIAGAVIAALVGLGVAVLGGATTDAGWGAVVAGVALFVGGAVLCGQQAGNGRVTQLTGDPVVATLTSVTGGLVGISAVCALVAALGGLDGVTLPEQWWLYLGGPLGTLITVAAAYAVRHLGTFVLTLTVVGGQMVMAVLLDLLGVVGLRWQTVVATAVVGLAVVLVVQRPGPRTSA
jgi:transporter family-2 protein